MKVFNIHKTRGTCKFVHIEADYVIFDAGVAAFYAGDCLVMAYSPWAWKTVHEEVIDDKSS